MHVQVFILLYTLLQKVERLTPSITCTFVNAFPAILYIRAYAIWGCTRIVLNILAAVFIVSQSDTTLFSLSFSHYKNQPCCALGTYFTVKLLQVIASEVVHL